MKLSWNNMTMEEKEINKPLLNLAELYLSASEELPEKKKVDMNAKEGSGAYEFALRNAGFNYCLEQCTMHSVNQEIKIHRLEKEVSRWGAERQSYKRAVLTLKQKLKEE